MAVCPFGTLFKSKIIKGPAVLSLHNFIWATCTRLQRSKVISCEDDDYKKNFLSIVPSAGREHRELWRSDDRHQSNGLLIGIPGCLSFCCHTAQLRVGPVVQLSRFFNCPVPGCLSLCCYTAGWSNCQDFFNFRNWNPGLSFGCC